jgi:endonuclease YncB( thermonuclease family)
MAKIVFKKLTRGLLNRDISNTSTLRILNYRIMTAILIAILIGLYPVVAWLDLFYYQNSIKSRNVRVVDGDTIVLDNHKIRLLGVDTPELKQRCVGKYYKCGEIAKKALVEIIGNSEVECSIGKKDKYKRNLSYCTARNQSLNYELIHLGLARVYMNDNLILKIAEFVARFNKVGIWSVGFDAPHNWRTKRKR